MTLNIFGRLLRVLLIAEMPQVLVMVVRHSRLRLSVPVRPSFGLKSDHNDMSSREKYESVSA